MLAGLAGLDPVLPGELQGGFDRFRAAGKEIELVELARERGGELAGELLHRAMGERGGRDVAELARLARQRLRDLRIRVAEIRDVGAAHGVEVALPLLVVQPAALTPHDARVAAAELAVEDVAVGIAVVRHSSPFPVVRGPRKAMRRPVYRRGSAVALSTYIASGCAHAQALVSGSYRCPYPPPPGIRPGRNRHAERQPRDRWAPACARGDRRGGAPLHRVPHSRVLGLASDAARDDHRHSVR